MPANIAAPPRQPAARQRAQGIKPASNGRDEPALALHIGGNGTEQRGRGLVGAVGTAKTLDSVVGAPARLEQEMNPALLVLRMKVCMVGSTRTARVREDQDALGSFHEALRFGDIGTGTTPFEALLTYAWRRHLARRV